MSPPELLLVKATLPDIGKQARSLGDELSCLDRGWVLNYVEWPNQYGRRGVRGEQRGEHMKEVSPERGNGRQRCAMIKGKSTRERREGYSR